MILFSKNKPKKPREQYLAQMYTTGLHSTGNLTFTEAGGNGSRLASWPAVRGVGTQLLAPGQVLVTKSASSSSRPVWRLTWCKWSPGPQPVAGRPAPQAWHPPCRRGAVGWEGKRCGQVHTNSSEGPGADGALTTSEGPGPGGDSYSGSTSKALLPRGLRVDINAALLPCSPIQIPGSSAEALRAPLLPGSPLPAKVLGPTAGEECLLKG